MQSVIREVSWQASSGIAAEGAGPNTGSLNQARVQADIIISGTGGHTALPMHGMQDACWPGPAAVAAHNPK
jgi:hypothetical protein